MKAIGTTSRRLKRIVASFDLVHSLLTAGEHRNHYSVTEDALPPDAVLVNVQHAWPNCLELLIYSESFPEIEVEGGIIPQLEPVCVNVVTAEKLRQCEEKVKPPETA